MEENLQELEEPEKGNDNFLIFLLDFELLNFLFLINNIFFPLFTDLQNNNLDDDIVYVDSMI